MLRIGIIGAGGISNAHLLHWTKIPEVKVIKISDIDIDRAKSRAEQYKIDYCQVQEILNDRNIDIVDICTPPGFHKEYVLKAAENKKHIFCEKPIALNVEDGFEMIKVCKEKNVKFNVGHVVRFFSEYSAIRNQVLQGAVGKPATVFISRCSGMPTGQGKWFHDPQKSGGVILDMSIHDIDWLRWVFGEVERVYANGLVYKLPNLSGNKNPLDYALINIRFKNRVIANVEGSWAEVSGFKTSVEIAGTKGLLSFNSDESVPLKLSVKPKDSSVNAQVIQSSPVQDDPFYLQFRHFIESILNNKEPEIVTAFDAVKALEICLAALESIKTGEVITL